MMERVRVRGPYATALTKIFLDSGMKIVQASSVIKDRLSIDFVDEPADVTIKVDDRDPAEILIIGRPSGVERILSLLREKLRLIYVKESLIDQFSTISVKVVDRKENICVGDFQGIRVNIETDECIVGKTIPVVVLAPIFEYEAPARGRRGFSLYRDIYTLFSWNTLTISRHIKDIKKREELISLSSIALREGLGIRWSSNASFVNPLDIEGNLKEDVHHLTKIKNNVIMEPNNIITFGRRIAKVRLNTFSSLVLDRIRSSVTSTVDGHHTLKVESHSLESIVDFVEFYANIHRDSKSHLKDSLYLFLLNKLVNSKKVFVKHRKLNGKEIMLGPFSVKYAEMPVILLERTFKGGGIYDGISILKEPGDVGLTVTSLFSNIVLHGYFRRDGELKGIYININTPVIFGPDFLVYDDLEVDVIYIPNKGASIIEKDSLEKVFREGKMPNELLTQIYQYSEELRSRLLSSSLYVADFVRLYLDIARANTQPELFKCYLDWMNQNV